MKESKFYPANVASPANSLLLTRRHVSSFSLGYWPRQDGKDASTHASLEVPRSKLNEGGGVRKFIYQKYLSKIYHSISAITLAALILIVVETL